MRETQPNLKKAHWRATSRLNMRNRELQAQADLPVAPCHKIRVKDSTQMDFGQV
jgi:hypothetical protein